MIEQYLKMGLEGLFLNNAILMTGMAGFFLGVFFMVSEFFYSKNLGVLMPLPLKPKQMIAAKISVLIIDQMWISLIVLLPSMILFGTQVTVSPLYWITMFFVLLFSQVFPILLQTIVILPLSRFINFGKYKDFFIYFLSILLMVIVFGFQFWVNNDLVNSTTSQNQVMNLLTNPESFISKLGSAYPPAFLAVKALTSTGLYGCLWLLAFVGFHIAGFWLALFVGEKTYYNTYKKFQDHNSGNTKANTKQVMSMISQRKNTFDSLLKREWRYFLRTPAFAFNGFANVLVFPLLIILFYFSKGNPEFQRIFSFITEQINLIIPIGILLGGLFGGMNMLAATCFSREGKMIKELKSLPVDIETIIRVKLVHVMTMSTIGPLSTAIIMSLFFNVGLLGFLEILVISEMLVLFMNTIQILLDATFPSLQWDNPQKAMKQNMNALYTILVVFGFTGGMGYLGFLLKDTLSPSIMGLTLMIIGIAGTTIFYPLSKKAIYKLLQRDFS
jgi:ABC-2 type transport system permease protein